MAERPILMSTPMVKALLDGTKVQTRRLVKPQPEGGLREPEEGFIHCASDGTVMGRQRYLYGDPGTCFGGTGTAYSRLTYRGGFIHLWDSINGKRAPWSSNPWVFVLTFRRTEAPQKEAA